VNDITNDAFRSADGVGSVLQNNGSNSAINNGNAVSAFVSDGAVDAEDTTFTTDSTQTARVEFDSGPGNTSVEDDSVDGAGAGTNGSDDENTIDAQAFQDAQGVFSVAQNNGPNSAINNGNTVSAIINDCVACTGSNTFNTTGSQTSVVEAGAATASEYQSPNTNTIGGSAFANVDGVYSVTQNNGANAALSNGNTISAIITN
jgi:hypothetical protein